MKLRTLIFLGGLFGGMNVIKGQAFYGTTGLLHAPTAVMQKDKTVMLGGNMLDVNILSRYWVRSEYHPYTYNLYFVSLAGSSIYLYVGKGDTWFFLLASANLGQVYQSGQIVSFPVEGMERRLVEGLDASGSDWCE